MNADYAYMLGTLWNIACAAWNIVCTLWIVVL